MTYTSGDKTIAWLHGQIKTPPFSAQARKEAGYLLRRLQLGESLGLPHSRPMPVIGRACHELRVADAGGEWRIIYRLDSAEIVVVEIFVKKVRRTPKRVIDACISRLRRYDDE